MDYFNNINLFNIKNFRSKFIIFIALICFLVFPEQTFAKEINPNGYYGLTMCTEIVTGAGQSEYVDCAYQNSQIVQGDSTIYTGLPRATQSFDGGTFNYSVVSNIFLFAYYDFKKGNYYTLNFAFDNGSYIYNNMTKFTNFSDLNYSYFYGSDYVENDGLSLTSYVINYNATDYNGNVVITFLATEDTSSYRFRINGLPLLRNNSFDYQQGYRVYLLSAFEEENNDSALLQQITNQNNTMINQNQQIIEGQSQGNEKLDNITNILEDDNPLNDGDLIDFFDGIVPSSDTPISDLLLLPMNLLDIYATSLGGTCSEFSLGTLLGTELSLPCIDLSDKLGSLWNLIDGIISIFMFYNIAMLCISIFDSITSLQSGFDLLYSPQHGNLSREGRGHSRGLY